MVGVGETFDEIAKVLTDLHEVGCAILTVGQYLPPTKAHYPLQRYYRPEEFADLVASIYELLGIGADDTMPHPQGSEARVAPAASEVPASGGRLSEIMAAPLRGSAR